MVNIVDFGQNATWNTLECLTLFVLVSIPVSTL